MNHENKSRARGRIDAFRRYCSDVIFRSAEKGRCLEARAVVRMNPRDELGGSESLLWTKAQDLRCVLQCENRKWPRLCEMRASQE